MAYLFFVWAKYGDRCQCGAFNNDEAAPRCANIQILLQRAHCRYLIGTHAKEEEKCGNKYLFIFIYIFATIFGFGIVIDNLLLYLCNYLLFSLFNICFDVFYLSPAQKSGLISLIIWQRTSTKPSLQSLICFYLHANLIWADNQRFVREKKTNFSIHTKMLRITYSYVPEP